MISRLAADLFRRHVSCGAGHDARRRHACRRHRRVRHTGFGEAEIEKSEGGITVAMFPCPFALQRSG
jgi:hypothetical protein